MSTISEGTFTIKCDVCKNTTDFPANESEFECTGGDSDREMGIENIYSWENTFNCDSCGKEIEFDYQVSEYPQGSYNHDFVNIKGGEKISGYTFNFADEPEPDDH